MANQFFQFKSFKVEQAHSPMKVGTDGVLLGAWCRVESADRQVLDIGTGTGLIALMVAQRYAEIGDGQTRIDAVEINSGCCLDAALNFAASSWSGSLRLHEVGVQQFAQQHNRSEFDHIVSNPPYFLSSLASPDEGRTEARHANSLTYEELAEGVARLLADSGRFSVILPTDEAALFGEIANAKGLHLARRCDVLPVPKAASKRVMMEFVKGQVAVPKQEKLVIEAGARHCYSDEYVALTRDFYLNM